MKDIPFFTTEHGAASLILREIPYRQLAYIKLLSSQEPKELLEDCLSFCRACGAERVYASGEDLPEGHPVHTSGVQMVRPLAGMEQAEACLFPVTEETVEKWRSIYNEKMAKVDNAAYMDSRDGKEMLQKGDGYFIHRDGLLLGIGRACGGSIDAVISLAPGAGETVVRALAELLYEDVVCLQVASTNEKAIGLYERLGFVKTRELSRWYRVL